VKKVGTHTLGDSILFEITATEKDPFQDRVKLTDPSQAELTIYEPDGSTPIKDSVDISNNTTSTDGEFFYVWHSYEDVNEGESGDYPCKIVFEKGGNKETHEIYVTIRDPKLPS